MKYLLWRLGIVLSNAGAYLIYKTELKDYSDKTI